MRLSAKILKNVIDINHFQQANQAMLVEGQINEIYVQLVDMDWSTKASPEQSSAFIQYPIRYISQATVFEATANFLSIDDDEAFSVIGTQPFADDKSIVKFSLSDTQLPNAGNMTITISEDGVERTIFVQNALNVELLNKGGC